MRNDLRLRKATEEDIPTIVRHRRLMFEEMGFQDGTQNDTMDRAVEGYLRDELPAGGYRGWMVTTPEGEVVAGAGLKVLRLPGKPFNPRGLSSYLMSLYVEPEYRRQGVARGLMEEMLRWSRDQGIREIRLHASDRGRSLYEGIGFRATNEMRLMLQDQPAGQQTSPQGQVGRLW